jgi:hypothetical protein
MCAMNYPVPTAAGTVVLLMLNSRIADTLVVYAGCRVPACTVVCACDPWEQVPGRALQLPEWHHPEQRLHSHLAAVSGGHGNNAVPVVAQYFCRNMFSSPRKSRNSLMHESGVCRM